MSRTADAEERWAIAVANGLRPVDVEAWIEALVGPRRCRHCGVEFPPVPGPGRLRAWCEGHHPRRPASPGRVCAGCGVSLDGRRRQAIVCGSRCASRPKRLRLRHGADPPTVQLV